MNSPGATRTASYRTWPNEYVMPGSAFLSSGIVRCGAGQTPEGRLPRANDTMRTQSKGVQIVAYRLWSELLAMASERIDPTQLSRLGADESTQEEGSNLLWYDAHRLTVEDRGWTDEAAWPTMKSRMKTNTACNNLIPCYSHVLWRGGSVPQGPVGVRPQVVC